jgi:hypothetical protein
MTKKIYYIVFILFFAVKLHAQDDVSQSRWQGVPVVADGNNNEWKKPFNLYDHLSGLIFTVSNDSSHLYICFTANDERKINKMMKAGWSIAISSKDKNKKFDASLTFPEVEVISADGKADDVMQGVRTDFKRGFDTYKLNVIGVTAQGFVSANGGIALQNNNGINIGLGSDSAQKFVVEIAIPLKELFAANNAQLNEEISLGVTINGLKKPKYSGAVSDGSASFGSGGGGKGRHRMSGTDADRDTYTAEKAGLFEKTNFKQRFRLGSHA